MFRTNSQIYDDDDDDGGGDDNDDEVGDDDGELSGKVAMSLQLAI